MYVCAGGEGWGTTARKPCTGLSIKRQSRAEQGRKMTESKGAHPLLSKREKPLSHSQLHIPGHQCPPPKSALRTGFLRLREVDSPCRHWAKEWGKNKQRAEDKQPEAGNPSEWGGTASIIFTSTRAKFQALLLRGVLGCLVFRQETDSWAWAPNEGEERPGGEGHRDQGEQLATT